MTKIIETKNIFEYGLNYTVETYISNDAPPLELCSAVYAFVFKDGQFLQTELREGERPQRMLDIPGGHLDAGETIEDAVVREVFEETGVIVKPHRIMAYKKVILLDPKPDVYRYTYPVSYMIFYHCEILEETPFDGNEETHGRVWLESKDFDKPGWCLNNKILFEEILKIIN